MVIARISIAHRRSWKKGLTRKGKVEKFIQQLEAVNVVFSFEFDKYKCIVQYVVAEIPHDAINKNEWIKSSS
jgi:hypothetical protein